MSTGNRDYANAANGERALAHRLRSHGFDVIRTAGSRGPFDLLATKAGQSYAIEVKRDRHRIPPVAWHTLWVLCQRHHWTPCLADGEGVWQLVGDKPARAPIDDWLMPITLVT